MKKKYIQPKAETYKIEVSQMIMQSGQSVESVQVYSEDYNEEMEDL